MLNKLCRLHDGVHDMPSDLASHLLPNVDREAIVEARPNACLRDAYLHLSLLPVQGWSQAPNTSFVPVYDRITFFGSSALRIS